MVNGRVCGDILAASSVRQVECTGTFGFGRSVSSKTNGDGATQSYVKALDILYVNVWT